jgi:hypothetical protein
MIDTKQQILAAIGDGAIAKALSTPLSTDEIDALVEKAKTDPGAPFESEVIARMAATKHADLPTFMRLRQRLKDVKIKISELDSALEKVVDKGEAANGEVDGRQGALLHSPRLSFGRTPLTAPLCFSRLLLSLNVM